MKMNKADFAREMTALGEIFNKEVSPAMAEMYWRVLSQYDAKVITAAISEAVKSCTFFPKPAELLEFINGNPDKLAQLRWAEIIGMLHASGGTDGRAWPSDGAAKQALAKVGGLSHLGKCSLYDLPRSLRDAFVAEYKSGFSKGLHRAKAKVNGAILPDHTNGGYKPLIEMQDISPMYQLPEPEYIGTEKDQPELIAVEYKDDLGRLARKVKI